MPKLRSWELQGSNTLKALLILGGAKVKIFHPPLHLDLSEFALKTCGSKGEKEIPLSLDGAKINSQA